MVVFSKRIFVCCDRGGEGRAGRRSWGTIVYSRERMERSRTIPLFRKKNKRIERVLKILERFVKERKLLAKNV